MIKKYVYGTPIETDAVVESIEPTNDPLSFLSQGMGEVPVFVYFMGEKDIVYGLGEANRGINKRGYIYDSFCSDDPVHTEEKRSLYGAHNFIVVATEVPFGVFVDIPGKVTFDIGFTESNMLRILPQDANFNLYIIDGKSPYDIIKQFRAMIGQSYIAPRWAFGFQQSRWSYMNADQVRQVVKQYRENKIPLDTVYLDIDYMQNYKDFTINEESFPNFPAFVQEMREQGIRLIPIIDAGVRIEDGYDIYEEGVGKGYFCKKADGSNFVAGVWPGRTHFPDFLNRDVREWFGAKYKRLLDSGIEGFWNDMNEPAIFYTDEGVQEGIDYIKAHENTTLDANSFFDFRDAIGGLSNRQKDYESFYHDIDGQIVRHDKVHNLYGYNMTRAAGEAFDILEPDKRILMFSRASYIGMHRYGGIWTGDNQSWWSHILLNIKMMPSLNMCGFLYTGADLGGFGGNCTRDLLLRWMAFGIFTPLMRNHSAIGTRDQECYAFGNSDDFKHMLSIRYSLIPYLYSEYMKACLNNEMMFRPIAFDFPNDEMAAQVEDQLMLGDGIMLTPVYQQNVSGRYVYLPEDMLYINFQSSSKRKYQVMRKGHHYIHVALNEVPLFLRKGKILPLCRTTDCTDNLDTSKLELIAYADSLLEVPIEYVLYEDDGISKDYGCKEQYLTITVQQDADGNYTAVSAKEIVRIAVMN